MLGFRTVGGSVIGGGGVASSTVVNPPPVDPQPEDPPAVGDIDPYKVPASRTVVFEGSIRVVTFEGSDNEAGT